MQHRFKKVAGKARAVISHRHGVSTLQKYQKGRGPPRTRPTVSQPATMQTPGAQHAAAPYSNAVIHEPDLCRFSLTLAGAPHPAVLEYQVSHDEKGQVLNLTHTYVPPELRGRGVAGKLVKFACAFAREHDVRVLPTCSYIPVYLQRNPADMDVVKET